MCLLLHRVFPGVLFAVWSTRHESDVAFGRKVMQSGIDFISVEVISSVFPPALGNGLPNVLCGKEKKWVLQSIRNCVSHALATLLGLNVDVLRQLRARDGALNRPPHEFNQLSKITSNLWSATLSRTNAPSDTKLQEDK